MAIPQRDVDRPIRVVLFCGPFLEPAAWKFACMLEEHPEIEFRGGFCQSEGRTLTAKLKDLWRRRGILALPILAAETAMSLNRYLAHPCSAVRLQRQMAGVATRIAVVPDIHAGQVLAKVRELEPDLGVIYGGPILRPELFEIPAFGTLGIHHGKVPQYRGKKTTFWAMYNGERSAGVTIQQVNAGVDTGAVVKAAEVSISGRTYRSVWQELEELGLALYLEAVLDVKRGKATFHAQAGKKGKLYKDPSPGDLLRFWWRRFGRQSI